MALIFTLTPAARAEEIGNGIEVRVIDGWRYAFNSDGSPAHGWLQIGDSWYFAGTDGGFIHGDHSISGKAYTFAADGTYVCEGVHRDGFDDDIYTLAVINTAEHWDLYELALALVNEERAKYGLDPLRLDRHLCVIATYRVYHMWKYNYAGHQYPAGVSQKQLCADRYFGKTLLIAEGFNHREAPPNDTFHQYRTPEEQIRIFHESLVNSPPHHVLMLEPTDTAAGFGLYFNNTRELFVQLFAEL